MTSTTPEQNRQLAVEYLEQIWESNSWNEEVLSPEYKVNNWPDDPVTLDELKTSITALHDAFPDLSVEFADVIATEDKVVIRERFTGTHTGEYSGISPTGKVVQFAGIVIFRIEDGQLMEAWTQIDNHRLRQQISDPG